MMTPTRLLICGTVIFLLTAGWTIAAQDQQQQQQPPSQDTQEAAPSDNHPNFPPGDGRDITIKVCSQCHDLDVIAEQQLDLDGWKTMVDQMASMGAQATDAQLDQIVKYLAKAFPAK